MKRHKLIVAIAALALASLEPARAWDITWVDQFGPPPVGSGGTAADATGAYLSGSVFGALPGQSGAGGTDVFVQKYGLSGNILWTRQFGTPQSDAGATMAADATGVYVTGYTRGTLPGQSSAGLFDAFVRKLDPDGNVLWTTQFGTAASDFPFQSGLASHASGVYVTGWTFGAFPGQPGGTGADVFLARLDPTSGNVIWVRQFGARGRMTNAIAGGVAADDTGVYVATLTIAPDGSHGADHLRKFDFAGNVLWTREIPATSACGQASWEVATYGTYVYVIAQTVERFFETEDPASCNPSDVAGDEIVGALRKYDANGNLIWKRRIKGRPKEGHGADQFTGAKRVWASGTGVYVSANLSTRFAGHLPNGPKSDRSPCEQLDPGFFDKFDAYVRRYDFDGNVIWTHQFGSNLFDIANSLATDAGRVYVAGDTVCQIDPSEPIPAGPSNVFLMGLAAQPTSLPGQVQLIVGQLETLSDKGRLLAGEFDSLVAPLEAALAALDRQASAARQALEAFVREVQTMQVRGTLTGVEAGALAGAANSIILQL